MNGESQCFMTIGAQHYHVYADVALSYAKQFILGWWRAEELLQHNMNIDIWLKEHYVSTCRGQGDGAMI